MLQAEGSVKIGGTEYATEVVSCQLVTRRNLTKKPATFGNLREVSSAGAIVEEMVITAFTSVAASSISDELWTAIRTDSGELAFLVKFIDTTVGADNAEYGGTIVVTGATVGGRVNEWNQQTWTFPVTAAGIAKDVTP